jgi:hypothetical protein
MKIHPTVTHLNGIVSVSLSAVFDGAQTDADDQSRIQAYGDPKINLGGNFVDAADPTFTFSTPGSEVYAALTTEMQGMVARFMKVQPPAAAGQQPVVPGPLDVISMNPVRAATVWTTAIQSRIATAVGQLRQVQPPKLTSLPDQII